MSQVTGREGRMFVTRHYGNTETETNEPLEVQRFEDGASPAHVHVKLGSTINMGNFESVRIDVGVTLPCYAEEVDPAFRKAMKLAQDEVKRQIAGVKVRNA